MRYLRESVVFDEPDEESADSRVIDWSRAAGSNWADLEMRMNGLKGELDSADNLDGYQDVGRRCREVLIDAANLVFDGAMVPDGEDMPGRSDAKRRIEFYLQAHVPGRSHQDLRKLIRQAYTLANTLTHSNSADRPMAFAAAQSTVLIVRTLQEIEVQQG